MDPSSAGQTGDGIVAGDEGVAVIVRTLPACVLGLVEGEEVIVMSLADCVVVITELLGIGLLVAKPLAEKKFQHVQR